MSTLTFTEVKETEKPSRLRTVLLLLTFGAIAVALFLHWLKLHNGAVYLYETSKSTASHFIESYGDIAVAKCRVLDNNYVQLYGINIKTNSYVDVVYDQDSPALKYCKGLTEGDVVKLELMDESEVVDLTSPFSARCCVQSDFIKVKRLNKKYVFNY